MQSTEKLCSSKRQATRARTPFHFRKGNPHLDSLKPATKALQVPTSPRVLFHRRVQIIYATWGNNPSEAGAGAKPGETHLAVQSKRAVRGK